MIFTSDNAHPAHPAIMQALVEANRGAMGSYGADPWTSRLEARLKEIFETDLAVFPVATGTAANALALSAICPPTGVVYCHDTAHIYEDECGAPELLTGGAKLFPVAGTAGMIDAAELEQGLRRFVKGFEHHQQPAALSLTQATEWGTAYRITELATLSDLAHAHGCRVHMDGARFANALVGLNASPADMTWRAGVDVLSFGATKNGALAAEAVIFFDPALAGDFRCRRKRGGHLFSKMRYLSAQLLAYLEGDLWLDSARHANGMAQRLADGLTALPGVRLAAPVEANEVFVDLPATMSARLRAAGAAFHNWPAAGPGGVRLVTAWATAPDDVTRFLATAAG